MLTASPDSRITVREVELETERWNAAYKFVGVVKLGVNEDPVKLRDPSYFVAGIPVQPMLTLWLAYELRVLASAHSIRYFNMKKSDIKDALLEHKCTAECNNLYYAFKELSQQKLSKPWEMGAIILNANQGANRVLSENPSPMDVDDNRWDKIAVEGEDDELHLSTDHLVPSTEDEKMRIMMRWQRELRSSNYLKDVCAVCGELKQLKLLKKVHGSNIRLDLLRNEDLPAHLQPITYARDAYNGAILDPKGLESTTELGLITTCNICRKDLSKNLMPKLALANWLYYAHDNLPERVAEAFKELTVFEKALVCRVRTNSILCRFTPSQGRPDEVLFSKYSRHIRGNVVSTPLNVPKLHYVLPPSPSAVRDTICTLFISRKPPTKENIHDLKPVLVRKSKIKTIIEFLLANNAHYHTSTGFGGLSTENLEALFEGADDVGIPSAAQIGFLPTGEDLDSAMASYDSRNDGLEGIFMENTAFTTGDCSARSYREMSMDALNWCRRGKPFLSSRAGSQPVPDINNPNWLSWAHPNADPYGIGGFNEPRRKRTISPEVQLRHMMNMGNPVFQSDHELAFDVYNIIRKADVNTSMRFIVPVSAYRNLINEIRGIEASKIEDLKLKYKTNPTYRPQSSEEQRIARLAAAVTPLARGVPGSTAQKIKMRNEIRGIINQKGSPTLFVTLNPSDYHNPLVAVLASGAKTCDDIEALAGLGIKSRATTALRHPAACAEFFDLMIRSFIKIVLRADEKGENRGLFGTCSAYYGTVETQGRGSLHCHMLIWLAGHPTAEVLAKTLSASSSYRTALTTWLDSVMDSGFNGARAYLNNLAGAEVEDADSKMEVHPGTVEGPNVRALKSKGAFSEIVEHTDDLLLKYNWHRHTGTCWKYLKHGEAKKPSNCRFGLDGSIQPLTLVDEESGKITVRRRHPRMTSYNPTVTFLMKCNTDIKFIGSGEDAKAFLYYVTDYITKAPLSMYAGLAALSYAIKLYGAKNVSMNLSTDNNEARKAMTIAVNSMLGHQEFSHPQVMAYLLGHGECYTSEVFQPANWAEILSFVNGLMARQGETTEDLGKRRDTALADLKLAVFNKNGKVSASNRLLDYIYRPEGEVFGSMGLYHHLAWASKVSKSTSDKLRNKGEDFSSKLHPQFHTHKTKVRLKPTVPVLLGPNLRRLSASEFEHEEWCKEMMILFKPWRNPTDLKEDVETWASALSSLRRNMDGWDAKVMANMTLLPEAKHARDSHSHRRHAMRTRLGVDGMATNEAAFTDQANTEAETNVYRLATEIGRTTTVGAMSLERLITAELSNVFTLCYDAQTETELIPDCKSNDESTVAFQYEDGNDNGQLEAQKAYMDAWRYRRGKQEDTEKKGAEDAVPKDGSRDRTKPKIQKPDASIDVVQKIRKKLSQRTDFIGPWDIVRMLVEERGLSNNHEQLKAFGIICHHVIEGGEQLLMYVGGEGGTGKSYLIESVVMLFNLLDKADTIRLGALTGIASSLINGQTLHSLLAMNLNKGASISKRLLEEWRGVKYLIIDEVSMIGAQFLAKISSRLRHARGDNEREAEKPFGGVNVVFMGDFLQLTPPRQPCLFSHYLVQNPTFMEARNADGLNSLTGAFLWRQVHKVVVLKKNKRQENDAVLAQILSKLRSDPDDESQPEMSAEQMLDHLRSREMSRVFALNPNSLKDFRDAPVIVGNRTLRDAANVELLTAHARRTNQTVYLYRATDTSSKKELVGGTARAAIEMPSSLTKDYLGLLPLFRGMKVMITENVSVEFKIMNGTEGVIRAVKHITDAEGNRRATIALVDIAGCKIKAPNLPRGVVPIFPKSVQLPMPITSNDNGASANTFTRSQLPLIPSYAITDYKSQGRTLEKAVVDLATARGQGVYVMLSRTMKLNGIIILRWFQATKVTQRKPQELRDELARLAKLEKQTDDFYKDEVMPHMGKPKVA